MRQTSSTRQRRLVAARRFQPLLIATLCLACLGQGCRSAQTQPQFTDEDDHYHDSAGLVVSDIVHQATSPDTSLPGADSPLATPQPRTIDSALPDEDEDQYWNLTLQEVLQFGLTNSRVLNDLGGTILRNPDAVPSNVMSAIVQSDPRFGIEGALSAFDTRFNVSSNLEKNDRALNNLFLSGGNTGRTFVQTLETTRAELVKRTVTGGQIGRLVAVLGIAILRLSW